jgi:hypothetical protein
LGGGEGLDGDHALRSPMSWDASGAAFSPAAATTAAAAAAASSVFSSILVLEVLLSSV